MTRPLLPFLRRWRQHALVRIALRLLATFAVLVAGLVLLSMLLDPGQSRVTPYTDEDATRAVAERDPQIDRSDPLVVWRDVDYTEGAKAAWWPQGESPVLADLVAAGKLPPVEARVGPEPVVLEGPEGIGQYGGTWIESIWAPRKFFSIDQNYSYANLVRWSPQGLPIVPHLAKHWEINEERTVFTFHLRRGMHWSDGHPFTANDIVYWYEMEVMHPRFGGGGWVSDVIDHVGGMGRVEKVDDHTIRFVFNRPHGIFLHKLAGTSGRQPVNSPRHYLEQFHPDSGDPELIATMMKTMNLPSPEAVYQRLKSPDNPAHPRLWPWVYKNFQANPPYAFVRNPYYYAVDPAGNQLPYLDRMHWEVKAPELVGVTASSGEINAQASSLNFNQYTLLATAQEERDYTLYEWIPSYRSALLIQPNINRKVLPTQPTSDTKRALLRDRRFRIALSHAINREAIIDTAYSGVGEPAQVDPGPASPFQSSLLANAYTAYDPATARALLDELGLTQFDREGFRTTPAGERLEFYIHLMGILDVHALQLVIDDWAEVGIRARMRIRSQNLWRTEVRSLIHDFSAAESWAEVFPMESPRHFVPTGNWTDWARGYAVWYKRGGLNNAPDAAMGGGIEPPADHPIRRAMELYNLAITEPSTAAQATIFRDIFAIAAENLWTINIATSPPYLAVFTNTMRNVPEVALAGNDLRSPGNLGFETYWLEDPENWSGSREVLAEEIATPGALPRVETAVAPTDGRMGAFFGTLVAWLFGLSALGGLLLIAVRHPYIGRRLLIMGPTLVVISIAAFTIIQLPPGDYLTTLMIQLEDEGTEISEREIEEFRELFHLDKSPVEQYLRWAGVYWFFSFEDRDRGLLQGNLGRSMETQRPVSEVVGDRIMLTIAVSLGTILFTWALAIPIGIYSAVRQYSVGDYLATLVGFLGMSIPNFLLAILLMYFSLEVFDMNVSGLFSPEYSTQPHWSWGKFVDLLQHIWVPIVILGTGGTAAMIRIMRANLLDELKKPYVATARAKGVRPIKLILKYPVRLALNPFISGIGSLFPHLISGGAITAIILSLPTVGPLMLYAFRAEDMFLAGSMLMVLSLLAVFGTLVSDLLLLVLDPRIRMQGGQR